jgi:hypothetical protein
MSENNLPCKSPGSVPTNRSLRLRSVPAGQTIPATWTSWPRRNKKRAPSLEYSGSVGTPLTVPHSTDHDSRLHCMPSSNPSFRVIFSSIVTSRYNRSHFFSDG